MKKKISKNVFLISPFEKDIISTDIKELLMIESMIKEENDIIYLKDKLIAKYDNGIILKQIINSLIIKIKESQNKGESGILIKIPSNNVEEIEKFVNN